MSENKTYLLKFKEVCRCCLDNPGSKSMWDEYLHDNEREIYGEMISDCFGVTWEANNDELICDSCVFRLREAVKLKIEFLAVQELLKENLVLEDETSKYEPKAGSDCEPLEASDILFTEFNDTESTDYPISDPEIEVRMEEKKLGKRPYKMYPKEAMDKAIEAVKVHGKSTLEAATKFSVPRRTLALRLLTPVDELEAKHAGDAKKSKLVNEIKILLQNTNAVPFKTKMTKRYCAFCFTDGPIFDDSVELSSHIKFYHKTNYIKDVELVMRPWHTNEVLKVDITELTCISCNVYIDDWNSMFQHFVEIHHQEFDEAYNKIIPFSLGPENKCVLCYESFSTFGNLDVHMNAHYCNYICYECGDPFLSSSRLDAHLRLHKTGKYPCEMCDKVFAIQQHKVKHVAAVHSSGAKDDKITNSMVGENGEDGTDMPCEYCGKCFNTSTSLNVHIQKMHTKKRKRSKKNYICGVCGVEFEKFVNLKYHWREHMESIPFRKMQNVTFT